MRPYPALPNLHLGVFGSAQLAFKKLEPMTPKYNSQKEVQRNPLYYHPTPDSWFADVDYPNPARQKQEPAPQQRRHKQPKRKAVIRVAKMQGWERRLLFILAAIAALKFLSDL